MVFLRYQFISPCMSNEVAGTFLKDSIADRLSSNNGFGFLTLLVLPQLPVCTIALQ